MNYIPPPSSLPPASIVDAYLRDSGGEGQDRSVPSQLIEVQSYCIKHELILRHVYKDTKSGKSTVGRDDFDRMIGDIESEKDNPHGILLWDYARFARNTKDAIFNIALIEKTGVIVHSLTDDIPEGEYKELIRFIKHLGNEAERKKNSAAVKREMHQLVANHKAMFGVPPRGIKREPLPPVTNERTGEPRTLHKWVPDPEWIPRIQRAFQLKAEGASLARIHKETHIFSSINSYTNFFSNPIYIGALHFGGKIYPDYCPPIVDKDTWDAVQKILERYANRRQLTDTLLHPRRHSASYLLSGLVHCGKCGSPLWGMTSRQRSGSYYYRYACTRAKRNRDCAFKPIPARPLEKAIIENLHLFFQDPENLRALIEADHLQSEGLANQQKEQAKQLQKRLTSLRSSIARITSAIAESGHSKSMLQKLRMLEMEETEIQTSIHNLTQSGAQRSRSAPPLTAPQIATLSKNFATRLSVLEPAALRQVIRTTVLQIKADRTDRYVYGTIQLKSHFRETKTPSEESPVIITASTPPTPVGAPRYTRSIEFRFTITRFGNKNARRPRS